MCVCVAPWWAQEDSSWELWPSLTKFCSLLCHGRASQEGQVKNPNLKKSFKSTTFYLSQHLSEPRLLLTWLCLHQTWQQEGIYTSTCWSQNLGREEKSVSSCFLLYVNKYLFAEYFLPPKAFIGQQLFNTAFLNSCVWLTAASPISEQGCWHFAFRKYKSVFR